MEALLERMRKQGQGRGFLTSCEAELQELMKQIDIMVAHKKAEWESQTQALESCLDIREQELSSLKNILDEKCKEIERLCQRLEGMEKLNHDVTVEYEQQLSKVQEELARLKRSYEKLLKKQLREARQSSKSQENDHSEVGILTKKLEEFRQKSLDWEKHRLNYQQHVASLEAQRKALAEQSELIQVLNDEKMELRATLLSQEDFVNSLQIHNEQLQQEVSKLTEMLCSNEALLRLESTKAKGIQPDEELTEKSQKLQLAEEHLYQAKAEIEKLKEQLLHKERSHNSELEGMKQEVTQLTKELHQRDITIASSSGSTLGLEQQLRTEIEKAEQKAVEHRAILAQLEMLKQENQHLSEMLQKVKNIPLAELQESYIKALNKVESEKQQLQKELAESRTVLETSSQIPQDKYESIVQEMQHQVIEIKNTESRKMQELQCKHDEELRALQARFDKAVQHYGEEIQKMQHLSARVSLSSTATELSPPIARSHSVESISCSPLVRSDPLIHGNKKFMYDAASDCDNEFLPLSPLPIANLGAIAAKFLEEEEKRSHHILERLDAHIEELKRESEKTVQQFAHQK